MKKFFAILISTILICCLSFGFVGCDKEKKPDGGDNSGNVSDDEENKGNGDNNGDGNGDDGSGNNGSDDGNGGEEVEIKDERFSFRAIEEDGNTVSYAVDGIGEVDDTRIVIPTHYNDLPVTRIDDYAFYENEDIISVTISGKITEIGDSAFYNCANLENLVIDAKITKMGDLAFAHCLKLQTLRIEDRVEEISYYAFYECESLKEVTIPASVKSIGESAFAFCTSLEKVNFNEGLEYIGDCAFGGCTTLEEFIMPQSVTEIGFGVLMFVGGFFFDGEVYDSNNSVRKIVMSDNITDIPDFAFSGCAVSRISIGKSVEKINYSAFYGCNQMESVVIPKSVKSIISFAFYQCYMLDTVYYEGTAEEWSAVKVSNTGNSIANAEVYCYSENAPSGGGNYWHYANDGITPVKW